MNKKFLSILSLIALLLLSKLTDVIRKEIGADSLMLHNLGVLTTEDLENKEDYLSLMEYNIETLSKALSNQ